MTKPFLTLGCASYEDFDGAYFTLQSLKMYHDLNDCELLLIDNNPTGEAAKHLKGIPGVRYIEMPERTGTAQPRNRVFQEAQGEYVVCMDSHVLLIPNAVAKLKDYWQARPNSKELVSGPILWDDLQSGSTHFDDFWRAEMWGIWGQAWQCRCAHQETNGLTEEPSLRFGVLQHSDQAKYQYCHYTSMKGDFPNSTTITCPRCGVALPKLIFQNHDQELLKLGYHRLGYKPTDPPFEVPAQGLGLFSCKKSFWEEIGGFNKDFRGFGGEEMYVHEKVRRAGGKTLCLPFLAWGHRFARANGVRFPLLRYQKVRNYVLGALELAGDNEQERDHRIQDIKEHFVGSGLMPLEQWDKLLADPQSEVIPPECETCQQNNGRALPPESAKTPIEVAAWNVQIPRDLEKHIPKLQELASKCQHVTEFSERRESAVGLLAGVYTSQGKLKSFNTDTDKLLITLQARWSDYIELKPTNSAQVDKIEETDLLFLDSSPHNYPQVWGELQKFGHSVRRFIVFHDTVSFGAGGQDNAPGLWEAIKQWIKAYPEWFVAYHTEEQYGLTVLSKHNEDKPPQRILPWPIEFGPGTELKDIFANLGVNPAPSCDCNSMAVQMNQWGVEGCREHFEEIAQRIRDNAARWGWQDALGNFAKGGLKAILSGLAFQINPLKPIESCIELAIKRAEKKAAEADNNN